MRRAWRWLTEPVARETTRGYMLLSIVNTVALCLIVIVWFW